MSNYNIINKGDEKEIRDLITLGSEETLMIEGKLVTKRYRLDREEKETLVRILLLRGMMNDEDNLISLARENGARFDSCTLSLACTTLNKDLLRKVLKQTDAKDVNWADAVENILETDNSLEFFQHVVDTYLGDDWEKYVPSHHILLPNTIAYLTLLKRFGKML